MNKHQKKTLGGKPPKSIYSESLSKLYTSFQCEEEDEDDEEEEVQTFDEFVKAGEIGETNEFGTGRFNFNDERRTIGILPILRTPQSAKLLISQLTKLLPAYFLTLKTRVLPNIELSFEKSTPCIIDRKRNLSFPLKSSRKKGPKPLDVFSVMDVAQEYVEDDMYCVLAIVESSIYDPENPLHLIYGRASGDRVAAITCSEYLGKEKFILQLSTAIHECMHCFGLDHCSSWRCIMNAFILPENIYFPVCPADLRKLHLALNFDHRERLQSLQDCYQFFQEQSEFSSEEKAVWGKELEWTRVYLKLLNN